MLIVLPVSADSVHIVNWADLGSWWLAEVEEDPAYEGVVTPLLMEVLDPMPGRRYLDVGCGEGRVMRSVEAVGATVEGLDLSFELAVRAGRAFVGELPTIAVRDDSYDGVYCVLTFEHVVDHRSFFEQAGRVVKDGGVLALVMNHPVWTAPDATPISDQYGEVLWRPGGYFSAGSTEMPAGDGSVVFHHRSMADLLNAAATAGWSLETMVEQPHHEFEDQDGIPRLMAARWRKMGVSG